MLHFHTYKPVSRIIVCRPFTCWGVCSPSLSCVDQSVPAFSLGPTVDLTPKCLSWSIWINTSDLQEVVWCWCVSTEMLSGNVVSNRRFKLNGSHPSFVLHFLSCPHVIMFELDMELRIQSHNVKFMFSCKIESNGDIVLLLQDWVFVQNLQYVYIVLLKRERF